MPQDILPPLQPAFVLRGHAAQVHALHFTIGNKRLFSADADGWVASWNLAYKRPVAVWKAHSNAVLGVGSWGPDRIITHGRDNKLLIWLLSEIDEPHLEKTLPVDIKDTTNSSATKQPWLLHAMPVNAMNFCSFAMCQDVLTQPHMSKHLTNGESKAGPILVAVPNVLDSSGIDIFQLPSRTRAAVIHKDKDLNSGMVMAMAMTTKTTHIQLAAGYESGHTIVWVQKDPGAPFEQLYCAQTHTQPVLSLALSPCKENYITGSADANICMHPFPLEASIWKDRGYKPLKTAATKHAGQQGLSYRSDGRIFATAGWDSHVRVYSKKTMRELASLKWHREGCYATAFASIPTQTQAQTQIQTDGGDGDREVKRELEGCGSAVAADVSSQEEATAVAVKCEAGDPDQTPANPNTSDAVAAVQQRNEGLDTVQQRREEKARTTHWLAVGSKDGKVSLWDIY